MADLSLKFRRFARTVARHHAKSIELLDEMLTKHHCPGLKVVVEAYRTFNAQTPEVSQVNLRGLFESHSGVMVFTFLSKEIGEEAVPFCKVEMYPESPVVPLRYKDPCEAQAIIDKAIDKLGRPAGTISYLAHIPFGIFKLCREEGWLLEKAVVKSELVFTLSYLKLSSTGAAKLSMDVDLNPIIIEKHKEQ